MEVQKSSAPDCQWKCIAHLLTQADPWTRVERKEHERIGGEQGLPVIDEAIWVKFFRFVRVHRETSRRNRRQLREQRP